MITWASVVIQGVHCIVSWHDKYHMSFTAYGACNGREYRFCFYRALQFTFPPPLPSPPPPPRSARNLKGRVSCMAQFHGKMERVYAYYKQRTDLWRTPSRIICPFFRLSHSFLPMKELENVQKGFSWSFTSGSWTNVHWFVKGCWTYTHFSAGDREICLRSIIAKHFWYRDCRWKQNTLPPQHTFHLQCVTLSNNRKSMGIVRICLRVRTC